MPKNPVENSMICGEIKNHRFMSDAFYNLINNFLVGDRGVEPLTSTTSMWRSSQLS